MHQRPGGSARPIVSVLVVGLIVCGTVMPVNALGPSWNWNAFVAWLAMIVQQQQVPTSSSGTSIVPTTVAPSTTAAPTTVAPTTVAPTTVAPTTTAATTTTTTRPASSGVAAPVSGACLNGPNPPANHYLRARVDGAPTLSNQWVSTMSAGGQTLNLLREPRYLGFPVNLIASNYPLADVRLQTWAYISDAVQYPTPQFLRYQGWPSGPSYDHYQLSVTSDCRTYELIGLANWPFNIFDGTIPGPWKAEGGVVWDANYTPKANSQGGPMGVTASLEPLTPQVIRISELFAGVINHPIHWYGTSCRGGARALGQAFVWPARGSDCVNDTPNDAAPPYGAWFRLRADYPMPSDPGARTIVTALKTYGMILGDGGYQGLAAEPGISAAAAAQVESVPLSAFEAVDTSGMRANPAAGVASADFWQVR